VNDAVICTTPPLCMTRPQRRRFILILILIPVAASLTGCGSQVELNQQLDDIASLPLWQRMMAIALSTLVSEDLACITAGVMASKEVLGFTWALLAAFLGIYVGDVALYALGRIGGMALLDRRPFRWIIPPERVAQAELLFEEHGGKLIFSSRLLPGSRLPVYAAAGVLKYSPWRFAIFMLLAGGLSTIILVSLSYHLGAAIFSYLEVYEQYAVPVFAGLIAAVWITIKLVEILATRRSRLTFLAQVRKLLRRLGIMAQRVKMRP